MQEDSVVWPHTSSGKFSVKSLYGCLISRSTTNKFKPVWHAMVPPKIKIFLWQAIRGGLPMADHIRKRNGPGSDPVPFVILWRTQTISFLVVFLLG